MNNSYLKMTNMLCPESKSGVTTVKATFKIRRSRDKDDTRETRLKSNIEKPKENT